MGYKITDKPHCPMCDVELISITMKCPTCFREWEMCGEHLVSKRRQVKLSKIPEVGDKVDDVIKPKQVFVLKGSGFRMQLTGYGKPEEVMFAIEQAINKDGSLRCHVSEDHV